MAVKTVIEAIRDGMDEEMARDPSVFLIGHGALYHSQSIEAMFAHVPGLKVVAPGTPADAKGLLKAAIRDPDPVLYLEHKRTYRLVKGEVPEGDEIVPIGKADLKRDGKDLSLIAYGLMLTYCLEVAEKLAADGISADVLDLRTIRPIDRAAIIATARKTGKVLVVHEDNPFAGVAAEVMAIIMEYAFDALDAPVMRLTGPDVPAMPFNHVLEAAFMPSPEKILAKARELAKY